MSGILLLRSKVGHWQVQAGCLHVAGEQRTQAEDCSLMFLKTINTVAHAMLMDAQMPVVLTGTADGNEAPASKVKQMNKNTAPKFQTPHEKAKSAPRPKQPVKARAKKSAKSIKPRKGKLGLLLGHSVVSVIRAMGKAGWTYETARAALDKAGIEAATHTVKVGLKRGRDGQKRIAPLTEKQLQSLKVKPTTAQKQ